MAFFYCDLDNDFVPCAGCISPIIKYFKDMSFLKQSVLCILGVTAMVAARPANPAPACIPQSDGSCLTVLQYGDEHNHYTTTIDGYLVVSDPAKGYVYADADGAATGRKALNADKRSDEDKSFLKGLNQRSIINKHIKNQPFRYPEQRALLSNFQHKAQENRKALYRPKPLTFTTGEARFPVILVSTKDRTFGDTSWYRSSLNETGFSEDGHYGSVRDYFLASSDSLFSPTFDVYPVKIDMETTMAGDADGDGEGKFVKAAIDSAVKRMGDLSRYDKDGDKFIDGLGVILAGTEANSGLWGHMYFYTVYTNPELYNGYIGGWWGGGRNSHGGNSWGNNYDGYKFDRYLLIAEMSDPTYYSKSGHNGIGIFVHEFSHILGLPDFYIPNDEAGQYSKRLEPYEIMAQGMYNGVTRSYQMGRCPAKYSAFERESMGWMTIPDLSSSVDLYSLDMIDSNKAYGVTNPKNKDQFYFIEYRPRTGWDSAVPDTADMGVLVWRVNYDAEAWEYYPNQDPQNQLYELTDVLNLKKKTTFNSFKFGDVGIYDAIKDSNRVCFATKQGITVKCPAPEPKSSAQAISSSAAAPTSSAAAIAVSSSSASVESSSSANTAAKSSTSHSAKSSVSSEIAAADSSLLMPAGSISPRASISISGQNLIVETAVSGTKHIRIIDALGSVVAKYDFDTEKLQIPIARTIRHGAYFVQVYTPQKTLATTRITY